MSLRKRKVSKTKVKCWKCEDTYYPPYGGYSLRYSCRLHQFDESNICLDCGLKDGTSNQNCYHLPEKKVLKCVIS